MFMRLLIALLCGAGTLPLSALPARESLSFNVEWRMITAGRTNLTWSTEKSGYKGQLQVFTSGLVSRLFRVNDVYDVEGTSGLCARQIHLQAEEGGKKRDTVVRWTGNKSKYVERDLIKNEVVLDRELDVPSCVHDILAALQKLRETPDLKPGQSFQLPISDGKKFVQARVDVQQKERIASKLGTFDTTRLEAFLFNDVLFKRDARLLIWLSDDPRRLPVQVQIRLRFHIGTVTFQLDKVEPSLGAQPK
jgi:hypothetical protein